MPHTPAPSGTPSPWTPPPRPPNRDPTKATIQEGRNSKWYADLYAFLLRLGWGRLFLLGAIVYLGIHAIFATIFVSIGACIKGARPGSWWDAYYFSVQTLSTIGYGGLTPAGAAGNALVIIESMVGIVCIALATGLVFSKFARPTARVVFSRVAVVHPHDGVPSLLFRLANQRDTNIVEATLKVTLLMDHVTVEGNSIRRLFDTKIQRSFTPIFVLSWLVIHPIDEESPLYGMTRQEMEDKDVRIIITMTGIDGIFSQTIHAYHVYWMEDLMWDMSFVDVLEPLPTKQIRIHFDRFHDVVPYQKKEVEANEGLALQADLVPGDPEDAEES